MHVCLVADRFGREKPSGVGVYIDRLLENMLREGPDTRFTGVSYRETAAPRIAPRANLAYRSIPGDRRLSRAAWSLVNHGQLDRLVSGVHVTHALLPLPVATRGPWVATVHDMTPIMFPEQYKLSDRALYALAIRATLKRDAHIIAISQKTADDLKRMYDIPDSRITVVHLGVDAQKVSVDEAAARALSMRLKLPEKYFSFVGTITRRKNLVNLVRAFARVARELTDVHLVMVGGDGYGAEDVREAIRTERLGERIHLPGYASRADMLAVMATSQAFVFPSTYEGFGIPPLEAMLQGTPVVAARGGAVPEVVGDAALLSDPEDVEGLANNMRRALTEPTLRAELRERGLARAAEFTWERMARETLAVYAKLA